MLFWDGSMDMTEQNAKQVGRKYTTLLYNADGWEGFWCYTISQIPSHHAVMECVVLSGYMCTQHQDGSVWTVTLCHDPHKPFPWTVSKDFVRSSTMMCSLRLCSWLLAWEQVCCGNHEFRSSLSLWKPYCFRHAALLEYRQTIKQDSYKKVASCAHQGDSRRLSFPLCRYTTEAPLSSCEVDLILEGLGQLGESFSCSTGPPTF